MRPAASETDGNDLPGAIAPGAIAPRLDADLAAELARGGWDHAWELTPEIHVPVAHPGARQDAWTRARMIEGEARDAFVMSSAPGAVDLACGEGWFCHELLRWGAGRVVGSEARPEHLRRASLMRAHFAIPEAELELCTEDELAVSTAPAEEGFDVALLLGIPDRVAAEHELLRVAASVTRGFCAIETRAAATGDVALAARAAGFATVERVRPPLHGSPPYVLGDLEVLIARRGGDS